MLRTFAGLIILTGLCAAAPAQGNCGPSVLGEPCAQGGIATQASGEPDLNLGVGNPIHLITGNKYQREVDLPPLVAGPALEITRHYNALSRSPSVLGQGWSLGYDTRLFTMAGRWQIVQADGSRITFTDLGGKPQPGRHGSLTAQGPHWLWVWPNGQQVRFDSNGYLVQITAGPPQPRAILNIIRHAHAGPLSGAIAKIVAATGQELTFHYQVSGDLAYLQSIHTPTGKFQYQYQPATALADPSTSTRFLRLQSVTRPDGTQRRYLYEPEHQAGNPFQLTGIEHSQPGRQQARRVNTWVYDPSGRAITSIQGPPNSLHNKVVIEYVRSPSPKSLGLTVVSNPAGQSSHFHTAIRGGRHVLLHITGAACAGCPAPDTRVSYNDQGLLAHANGTDIDRYPAGQLKQLRIQGFGWPGLRLNYRDSGARTSWHSNLTGTEHTIYNERHLPIRRAFANGDTWDYHYDRVGRPVRIMAKNTLGSQQTTLHWQGKLLRRIDHPHENETRQYDEHQRLRQRTISRLMASTVSNPAAAHLYSDGFKYDSQQRLSEHQLPEGGALHYAWGRGNRLLRLDWQDAQGRMHNVVRSTPPLPGYQYGNGLRLKTWLQQGQASQLMVYSSQTWPQPPVFIQRLHYDQRRQLQQENLGFATGGTNEVWRYAYNPQAQLIGAQGLRADVVWYAWQNDGALAALQSGSQTRKPEIKRDPSGLPTQFADYRLRYGPNRRLSQVEQQGQPLETYRHNAFGQRISKQSLRARTDYFYVNNQLVAESRQLNGLVPAQGSRPSITRRYIYAHQVLVGVIDYDDVHPHGLLYFVHSDLIGAPRIMTDTHKRLRWQASYSPTGQATQIAGDLDLQLRLPGQIADASTGWHDNLLRTYLPQLGQYLEPDPLGPVPVNQALGYANQQPKRYVDPWGLLLFAFDGTRNSPETQTNVWKLSQRYQDGPVFYHTGPGNPAYTDRDAITAYSASQIIETQWQSLLNTLNQPAANGTDIIPIDIIGFSRGAALARHFGNLINNNVARGLFSYTDELRGLITACVDLRFMGLFDTVAQFGLGGVRNVNYDLSIASAWEWVAHAVALHERRWLFPLSSVNDSASLNTIEAPFIGAHADIGGGIAYGEPDAGTSGGDLSDVAFNWMLWQARAVSLRFSQGDPSPYEITAPFLHDQRSVVARSIQNGDRRIDAADGSLLHQYQDEHARLGSSQRNDVEKLIQRYDNWRLLDSNQVGTVNMNGYAQWLQAELGWQPLPL